MLDEAAAAVATGAAGNIVAYLVQGHADTLRARIAAIFRHGGPERESEALRMLADDASALSQSTGNQAAATVRWTALLTAVLAAHSEACPEVEALAASAPAATKTVHIGSQHNHGSGTFIGGDNTGFIHLRGPEPS
jgi:hypothetical protein